MDINKEIVVARYQEDTSWLNLINTFDKKTIYNKYDEDSSNYLQNVGREGHTYLHHIIKNYDNLADYTLFCQGDPFFHHSSFMQDCTNIDNLIKDKSILFLCEKAQEKVWGIQGPKHPIGLPVYYFFNLLFGVKLSTNQMLNIYYGSQFIISKENIRVRPKDFYKFLINFISYEMDPIEGYVFERLWPYIFNEHLTISEKYKLFHGKIYKKVHKLRRKKCK